MKKTQPIVARWLRAATLSLPLLAFLAASFIPSGAFAHGGEDHGDAKPVAIAGTNPRVDAHSDLFEIVAIPSGADKGKLIIFLTDVWTNAPIANAAIEITRLDTTAKAIAKKGVYELEAPWVKVPGRYDLTFAVTAGDLSDLLIGSLLIPDAAVAGERHDSIWDHLRPQFIPAASIGQWVAALVAVIALLITVFSLRTTGVVRRTGLAIAILTGMSGVVVAALSLVRGSAGGNLSAAASLDLPESARRSADGSVFVPKSTQRLLDVRTVRTEAVQSAQKTVRLIGQVIPDLNRSGLVQSLLPGRIEAAEGGFPAIGSRVKSGDILGYLVPRVEFKDQSDIRQTTGDLDRQISLAESKLARLERLKNVVAESQIIDGRIELAGLRKRRAELKPMVANREPLVAPVDGVVSQANVVSGQVVEAQTLLFQIVDPENLWIEALAFDPVAASSIERAAGEAVAKSADGREARIMFAGRGLTLKQQAVPLRFKIKGSNSGFSIGEPVTVHAPIDEAISSIPLPRSSIVRSASGQSIIWIHTKPELFEQRIVAAEPIDADRVGITAGLEPDARVVVRGAELINQVR